MIKLKIWLYNWLAKDLGKLGREGDTELAHVNTWEANLLKAHGGSGTINPVTGLREYKGGGGGSSQTQTTTQNIDPAILPYITYGLGQAKNLYQRTISKLLSKSNLCSSIRNYKNSIKFSK